ncbi:MAG: hypothetical protein KGP29_06395 [Proteobacteria bacterium]|nr:hypothetical protein [Pseudomonadota bacterium]
MQIKKSSYQKILNQIRASIKKTQGKILRNKVEMSWRIGQIIEQNLEKKDEKTYGKHLIEKLERDTKISSTVLYKMRSFYQTYPKLPKDDPKLNWSHYRVLSGVKNPNQRQVLEDLTRENSWDSDKLQEEKASFEKGGGSLSQSESETEDFSDLRSKQKSPSTANAAPPSFSKRAIKPSRGKVFTYKIVEVIGSDKKFFDCGFGIFREANQPLPRGAKVVFLKGSKPVKSTATPQQVYTYKAFLKRIVDGDTLHVNIDLGFETWHEETIRLAKINTAEAKTESGKNATGELKKILESAPFFVLKSIKTDIYNRYVADIFLPEKGETDLQKIADKGVYLNQLLLDGGWAEIF